MSQLLQALGFVSCSIFWAVNLPWAGWFIISHWCKGPRRHICLLFSSALETPLDDILCFIFTKKTCIVQVSVCLGTATPENACMLPLFQSSQKSLHRCHRSVYHVLTDCLMKGSWPNCVAWICPGCSGLELGSAFSPETRFGAKT